MSSYVNVCFPQFEWWLSYLCSDISPYSSAVATQPGFSGAIDVVDSGMAPKRRPRSQAQLDALAANRQKRQKVAEENREKIKAQKDLAESSTIILERTDDASVDRTIQSRLRVSFPEWVKTDLRMNSLQKIFAHLLGGSVHTATKSLRADQNGCDLRTADLHRIALAEMILQVDRERRTRTEWTVARSGMRPVQYLDLDSFDETPMPVARRDEAHGRGQPGQSGSGENRSCFKPTQAKAKKIVQTTKILQAKSGYSMLLRDDNGEFWIFRGSTINPLAHIETTSAECLKKCLSTRQAISEAAELFESKTRITPLDGAQSNERMERSEMRTRKPGWSRISILCEDHITVNLISHTMNIVSTDVSGQIRWALSWKHPMGRHHGKCILRNIVDEWLNIQRGRPPSYVAKRLRMLLRLTMAGSRRQLQRSLNCLFLPNGDPCIIGSIGFWIPEDMGFDRPTIVDAVATALDDLFFSNNIVCIKRHRWRGAYEGIGDLCLHEGFWGIGRELFKRFVRLVQSKQLKSQNANAREDPTETDFQAEANMHRNLGKSFIETKPRGRALVMRMCLEAVRLYQEDRHPTDI